MTEWQIKWVDRSGDHTNHITEVGGENATAWRITVAMVIANIRQGHRFYTQVGQYPNAYVEVVADRYIRTIPDGTTRDNLLSLPPIPAHCRPPS